MRLTLKELRHFSGPVFSENSYSSFLFSFPVPFFFSFDFFPPAFFYPSSLPSYFGSFTFQSCQCLLYFHALFLSRLHFPPLLHTEDPNMPFQNYMLSVRVVGVTDELVSICEGAIPALSVEIVVHSETLVPICKATWRHVCEDGNRETGVTCLDYGRVLVQNHNAQFNVSFPFRNRK